MTSPDANNQQHQIQAAVHPENHTLNKKEPSKVKHRKYTKKTIKVKQHKRKQDTWITTRAFTPLFNFIFSFYNKTRIGKPRIIVACISLAFSVSALVLLVYYLCQSADIPSTVFLAMAAIVLLIYIITLLAHILDEALRTPFAREISDCDLIAFFILVAFTMMTTGFYKKVDYIWEVLIICLTFLGSFLFTFMSCACIILGILFIFCITAELLSKLLFCRVCLKKDNTENFIYLTFPYQQEEVTECIICLSQYKKDDIVCELKCHRLHIFHDECFIEWRKRKSVCPICRAPMISQ